ncbi:MAG: hypothetical protein NZM40_08875 [Sphingomonadaceae bacterium]|uniref:DNA polymerase III subunit delta n=1 Tax=Thermaurantiacus sp. TaxID=2820283 RepID=UPI00298F14DA|nr:hypothetical protein [Thermaurantiacus sp.]MCS6987521.1 hypothetical protein [Sphingomonadaceae bacterium]MDW8415122.1 hypothetical protein [Thermaurantiacus sp.]
MGEDLGQGEALARATLAALGGPRKELAPAALVAEPARLADEAASLPLFGERPVLFVRAHLHERPEALAPAIAALLDAPVAGNPVVVLAGGLPRTSALRRLGEGHPAARLVVAWAPERGQVAAQVAALARARGLVVPAHLAPRLWAAGGASPAGVEAELEKLALYLAAAPDRPQTVDEAALDALGPNAPGADADEAVAALLRRDVGALAQALARGAGDEVVGLLRLAGARLTRLLELAIRRREQGLTPEEIVARASPPVFWKERGLHVEALGRWSVEELGAAIEACLAAERAVKSAGSAGERIGRHELLMLAAAPAALGRPTAKS